MHALRDFNIRGASGAARPNIHLLPAGLEMDDCDEAILIAADIENHALANQIRVGERFAHIGEIEPLRLPGATHPRA
ncbi:MAG TPA: hypothetical protein PK867_25355 [Pirellulales bacterium]|nr:hypothetical protein [Pirellulales bacterium]